MRALALFILAAATALLLAKLLEVNHADECV
jgi:hypothetical protein